MEAHGMSAHSALETATTCMSEGERSTLALCVLSEWESAVGATTRTNAGE